MAGDGRRRRNASGSAPCTAGKAAAPLGTAAPEVRMTRGSAKKAAHDAAIAQPPAKVGGKKRVAAGSGEEKENRPQRGAVAKRAAAAVQQSEAAVAAEPVSKRLCRASKASPALAAVATAAPGSNTRKGSRHKPGNRTPQHHIEAEQEKLARPAAEHIWRQQQQAPLRQLEEEPLTSVGPQPSQSLHDSILKSPSPPRRVKATASTAGVASLATLLAVAAGGPQVGAAAAAFVDQGAVDQPVHPRQQHQHVQQAQQPPGITAAEPAAAAAAVQPDPAEAVVERTGSSPLSASVAKRQRASLGQKPPLHLLPDAATGVAAAAATAGAALQRQLSRLEASPDGSNATGWPPASVSFNLPQSAARGPSAGGVGSSPGTSTAVQKAEGWWDPLDNGKVQAVKAVLHAGGYAKGSIPACREKQAVAVSTWLRRQLAQHRGGSIYLSGLPGTGKSLTAHEVVRQCWQPLPPASSNDGTAAGGEVDEPHQALPPPALLSINCMSITDPKQVVERILLGYGQACVAPHPEATLAAGEDPILYPTAAEGGGGKARRRSGSDPLQQLRRLVLAPLPTATSATSTDAAAAPAPAQGRKGRKRPSSSAAAAAGGVGGTGDSCMRGMLVVILDELDALLSGSKGEELAESLFALAAASRSRLLLLGIANSVDLVQQLMQPGGALHRRNLHCAHQLFPAYLRQEFSQVLAQRLGSLPGPVFEPKAIELCSSKMANGNGDMRRALEACAQALDAVVKEAAAMKEAGVASGTSSQAAGGAPEPGSGFVNLRCMAAALSRVTGGIGMGNDNVRAIRALPPQQKLLVCTAGKLLGDSLSSRGLPVRKPAPMPTAGSSRKAAGGGAAASRARASFMSPANSGTSSRKSGGSLISGTSAASGLLRNREVLLLGQLEEAFTHLCKQVGMEPYNSREFATAVEALQDLGLVGLAAAREAKWRRVTLRVPDDDVMLALADVPVLKNLV